MFEVVKVATLGDHLSAGGQPTSLPISSSASHRLKSDVRNTLSWSGQIHLTTSEKYFSSTTLIPVSHPTRYLSYLPISHDQSCHFFDLSLSIVHMIDWFSFVTVKVFYKVSFIICEVQTRILPWEDLIPKVNVTIVDLTSNTLSVWFPILWHSKFKHQLRRRSLYEIDSCFILISWYSGQVLVTG